MEAIYHPRACFNFVLFEPTSECLLGDSVLGVRCYYPSKICLLLALVCSQAVMLSMYLIRISSFGKIDANPQHSLLLQTMIGIPVAVVLKL